LSHGLVTLILAISHPRDFRHVVLISDDIYFPFRDKTRYEKSVCLLLLLYIVFFCLEKKCDAYIRDNLKAPSLKLVMQWGRQLHLDPSTIKALSARIKLRHALGISPPPPVCHHFCINAQSLGPDPGHISNSKNWKRTTPRSFRSPYFAQGDIGKKNIPPTPPSCLFITF
jgi:hypothetical protein